MLKNGMSNRCDAQYASRPNSCSGAAYVSITSGMYMVLEPLPKGGTMWLRRSSCMAMFALAQLCKS